MDSPKINNTIGYNSAYISLTLLDELDHCIGGYGKPSVEFIFSLNTFVESFIGCSEFYTSLDELNHLNLTSPALFPNGRPVLNIIAKAAGLKFVNGVVSNAGEVIYQQKTQGRTRKELEQAFISERGKTLKAKYFLQSDVDRSIEKIPLLKAIFLENQLTISEAFSTSFELVSNLINVSNTSSIQTTLPITLFDKQINQLAKLPYSIDALNKLAELHNVKVDQLRTALAYKLMPIPPFTNILLAQINSIIDIPDKLLQLRADFQELRNKFIELEKNVLEAPTLKVQWDAQKSFDEFWLVFNKKYLGDRNRLFYTRLDVFNDTDLESAANNVLTGEGFIEGFKDVNYAKIAGNVLSKTLGWNRDRKIINRFKGLTNIWDLFESSKGITEQLPHFERVFKVKFETSQLQKVHDYVKNMKVITQ
jgi:hypothetical protein